MYTLVGAVGNGGGHACVGGRNMWEVSVPFPQLYCELKTALKSLKRPQARFDPEAIVCLP